MCRRVGHAPRAVAGAAGAHCGQSRKRRVRLRPERRDEHGDDDTDGNNVADVDDKQKQPLNASTLRYATSCLLSSRLCARFARHATRDATGTRRAMAAAQRR